jgi:histidinol-phosphate aminotransferase
MTIQSNILHVSRLDGVNLKKFTNFLRMDKNERIDNYSNKVLNDFKKNIKSVDITNYPNEQNLTKNLSKFLKVKKNQILITPGSDAGIKYIFETFIKSKSKIASLTPTYAMFEFYSQLYKCKCLKISYDQNFKIDFDDIKKTINSKIKLIYLANPNQPSGTSIDDNHIKKILNLSKKKNLLVVIDEAYIDFSSKNSLIKYINNYKNLFIMRTFSKGFGSAGLRVGYIISNAANIKEVNKVRPLHNINSIGLKFCSFLLKNKSLIKKNTLDVKYSKSLLYEYCKKRNLNYLASDTNFVNIFFTENECIKILNYLKNKKILVRLRIYQTKNKKLFSIRISLGQKKTLIILLKHLSKYLKNNAIKK